jgi:hypothetical protein
VNDPPVQQFPLASTTAQQAPLTHCAPFPQHVPPHSGVEQQMLTVGCAKGATDLQSPAEQQTDPHADCPDGQHNGLGASSAHACPVGQQMPPHAA